MRRIAVHLLRPVRFARKHQTLKTTPAIEAGVADHIWSLEEIAGLLDKPRIL